MKALLTGGTALVALVGAPIRCHAWDLHPIASEPACELTAVDRTYLSSAGRSLYVEAHTVGFVAGGLLIVGQPVYEWIENTGGRLTPTDPSSTDLGVWVTDGLVRRIPFPPGIHRVEWVRGAALSSDRWGFVMQELDAPAGTDPVRGRIVYSEFIFTATPQGAEIAAGRAGRWSAVGDVFAPDDRWDSIVPMGWPQLAPGDGRLVWLGLARTRRGMMDVVLFERTRTGWSSSVAVADWADVAVLRVAPVGPWTLAVGGLDPDFGSQVASIRVLTMVDGVGGESVRLDLGGSGDRFRRPVVSGEDDPDPDVAWIRADADGQRRVWLATNVHGARRPVPVLLDPWGDHVRYGGRLGDSDVWLTRRTSALTNSQTLRIVGMEDGVPVEIAALPYPFVGDFEVVRDPAGDLLVVGPDAEMSTFTPSVRSLLIRLSIDCT